MERGRGSGTWKKEEEVGLGKRGKSGRWDMEKRKVVGGTYRKRKIFKLAMERGRGGGT